MIKTRLLIISLFLALIGVPLAAIASDISNAQYFGTILVSNNSTLATNVATTSGSSVNTTNLINGNYINATATNAVVRSSSGADIPFMPGYTPDYNPWCFWVPSIGANSYLNYILYTANSTGGKIRYFPADGGMTTPDHASMELSVNSTIEQKGWVNTDNETGKYLVYKDGAFRTIASPTVSGNITSQIVSFSDDFDTDDWTDVGTKIVVDTGDERLEYESERSAVDNRCYYDLGIIGNDSWDLDFVWYPTAQAGASPYFYFGVSSALENIAGASGDAIYMELVADGVYIYRIDGGASAHGSSISWNVNTTYYVSLARTSSTGASLSVYSDEARFTHITGSPLTLTIPSTIVSLRYLQASNNADNGGADREQVGWIDNIAIWDGLSVTATGVSSGEHAIKTALPYALDFVAANTDYVQVPDSNDFSFTDGAGNDEPFSIALWAKPDDTSSQYLISHYLTTGNNREWDFMFFTADELSAQLTKKDDGGTYIRLKSDVAMTGYEGLWTHFALTYDGTETSAGMALYVNGSPIAASDDSAGAYTGMTISSVNLIIGGYGNLSGLWYDGSMSEVKIYDVELTPAQVSADFNGTHKATDLVAYWKFDEGVSKPVDSSGNGHHAITNIADWISLLKLYIDDLLKDITTGASVPDNSSNWTFVVNGSMPYLESHEIVIDGVQAQFIEWEYDNVFTDQSVNTNDATPTFRSASSDADVSAEMTNFSPIAEAKAPDYALGEAPAFIDSDALTGNVTGTFGTTPDTGTGTFPLAGVIKAIADATSTPAQLPLLIIAVVIILAVSLSFSALARRSGSGTILVKIILIAAFMGIFVALENFAIDFWMILVFLIIAIAVAFASRQLGWT